MMHPPTVVIALLLCTILNSPGSRFAVVTGLWVRHSKSPFEDQMALFNHVLSNDEQWSPVLNQVIKLSGFTLPRYHLPESYIELLNRVQLIDPKDTEDHTVRFVIEQLMNKTPWSGTNVNFTAYALSIGTTCFTYNNVSFVIDRAINRIGLLANKIEEKTPRNENGTHSEHLEMFHEALEDMCAMFVVMMDKVAAVEGDLTFFTTSLYDYGNVDKTDKNFVVLTVFKFIFDEVNKRLQRHCGGIEHKTIYEYLGQYEKLNNSPSTFDELEVNNETLKLETTEFKKIINSMIEVYHGLNIETMHTKTWIQILDYKLPVSKGIEFFIEYMLCALEKKKELHKTKSSRYKEAEKKTKNEQITKRISFKMEELQNALSGINEN